MAVLEYRDTDGQFKKLIIPGGSSGGTSNVEYLSDIKDVKITNPEKDQILAYDDTTKTWINKKNGAVAELPNNIAYITDSSETKEIKIRANRHNYSTEEQVVGTWIDGKPIYEKTIIEDCEYTGVYNSIRYFYKTLISNVDSLINSYGVIKFDNGDGIKTCSFPLGEGDWNSRPSLHGYTLIQPETTDVQFYLVIHTSDYTFTSFKIIATILYTKISDT